MNAVVIHSIPLPKGVEACTVPTSECDYIVIINSTLGEERQKQALHHELCHIGMEHFYHECTIKLLEQAADCGPEQPLSTSYNILCGFTA